MPIKFTTLRGEIDSEIQKQIQRFNQAVIRTLGYIGETCVKEARLKGSYQDQTYNLRSSTGYVIVRNGEILRKGGFEEAGKAGITGEKGCVDGLSYAKHLALIQPAGFALVVVAGMAYAKYVSDKGYDVLDSAENIANSMSKRLLKQLEDLWD